MFIGSLNYLSEKHSVRVAGIHNFTFIATGNGVIELNECESKATLTLARDYNGLENKRSQLNQRRKGNNIFFRQKGEVYMRVESKNTVGLQWMSEHPDTFNGYGYTYYDASSFRIHKANQGDLRLGIQPLKITEKVPNKMVPPSIVSLAYNVYIAS
jgi:hypothetical protein